MAKFELNSLLSYDDAALLEELRRIASLVDAPYLTAAAFNKLSKCSASTIQHRFGGWKRALEMVGLGHRFSHSKSGKSAARREFSDEFLLNELRAVAATLRKASITFDEFNAHGSVHGETVRRRFGGSWQKALERAGMQVCNLGRRYSDDEYFENLLTAWTHYGRQPTYGEMDREPSRIRARAYEAKWGTWRKALLAFIDVAERHDDAELDEDSDRGIDPPEACDPTPVDRVRPRRTQKKRHDPSDSRHIPLSLRYQILKRDSFRCVGCGASPSTKLGCVLHVDHILAFSNGGKTLVENLRTLCEECNLGKGAGAG